MELSGEEKQFLNAQQSLVKLEEKTKYVPFTFEEKHLSLNTFEEQYVFPQPQTFQNKYLSQFQPDANPTPNPDASPTPEFYKVFYRPKS